MSSESDQNRPRGCQLTTPVLDLRLGQRSARKPRERIRDARHSLLALALLVISACSSEHETVLPEKSYNAYGGSWKYSKTEVNIEYPCLGSPHGIIGSCNGYRELHFLTSDAGERIPVHHRIYALQRDGTYKKIKCCEYFREQADLYNFHHKLVLRLENAREFITDCFIYLLAPQTTSSNLTLATESLQALHTASLILRSKYSK